MLSEVLYGLHQHCGRTAPSMRPSAHTSVISDMNDINPTPQDPLQPIQQDPAAADASGLPNPAPNQPVLQLPAPDPVMPPPYTSSTPVSGMPTNSLAVISLALSISSWVLLFGIGGVAGVILGILARNEIKNSHGTQGGDGMALAGIIVGAANIIMVCLGLLCVGAITLAAITSN